MGDGRLITKETTNVIVYKGEKLIFIISKINYLTNKKQKCFRVHRYFFKHYMLSSGDMLEDTNGSIQSRKRVSTVISNKQKVFLMKIF